MNKPPEKLRIVFNTESGRHYETGAPLNELIGKYTEHFYTLEKPMTQKTENLTTEEAWAAMARGECVKTKKQIQTLVDVDGFSELRYYSHSTKQWFSTSLFEVGPYSIVPDPSKPKEVEDNDLSSSKMKVMSRARGMDKSGKMADLALMIMDWVHCEFQRKP
jgi:hypothetical protein